MTKYLYPAPGQLILRCIVSSKVGKKTFTTNEIGTCSMFNLARDYRDKWNNAKYNAWYKHKHKGGSSGAMIQVIDYDFRYFIDVVDIKRIRRKDGHYYSVSIDKRTGKRTSPDIRWRKETYEEEIL